MPDYCHCCHPCLDAALARSFFPCKKMITLFKAEPFKVELAYAPDDRIPQAYSCALGTYTVELPKVGPGGKLLGCLIKRAVVHTINKDLHASA